MGVGDPTGRIRKAIDEAERELEEEKPTNTLGREEMEKRGYRLVYERLSPRDLARALDSGRLGITTPVVVLYSSMDCSGDIYIPKERTGGSS